MFRDKFRDKFRDTVVGKQRLIVGSGEFYSMLMAKSGGLV
jgi:hypothetical protein